MIGADAQPDIFAGREGNKVKERLQEVFVLRSIACLSIGLLHSINKIYDDPSETVNVIRLILSFGTPAFVFISEMVLSHAYPDGVPRGFWTKRVKYILVPYVVFGFVHALGEAVLEAEGALIPAFLKYSVQYILLGDFALYFILIIFQFYLLHAFVAPKVFSRFSAKTVLSVSLVVSMSYWAFFNFVPRFPIPFAEYVYTRFFMLPFVGWSFYFALAWYCGRRYRELIALLNRWRVAVWLAFAASGAWMIGNLLTDTITAVSSKRLDMVLFATSASLFVLHVASRARRIHPFWVKTSQISFGLFLVHPVLYGILELVLFRLPGMRGTPLGAAVLFATGMSLSAWAVLTAYRFPGGNYVVGRIGPGLTVLRPQ